VDVRIDFGSISNRSIDPGGGALPQQQQQQQQHYTFFFIQSGNKDDARGLSVDFSGYFDLLRRLKPQQNRRTASPTTTNKKRNLR